MAKQTSRRTSNSQTAQIASLQECFSAMVTQTDKILKHLEGNSHPGLLQRQTVTEGVLEEIQKDLAAHTLTLGMMEKNQGHLQDLVEQHMSPRNPEHKTVAASWERDKWGVIKAVALIAGIVWVAVETGFLARALSLLGIPNL